MAGEESVVQQYLVAKLAEVDARLAMLEARSPSSQERERLVELSARLLSALSFYEPTRNVVETRNGADRRESVQ